MRWFMLLMCQDFGMAETLRLWDTLLAAVGPNNAESGVPRFDFIDFVAVALVQSPQVSEPIKEGNDFSTCMETL